MVHRDNAEHYMWGEGCDGWHLLKTPQLSVIEERMPAGASEKRHYHAKSHQFFYVLSGVLTLETGGHERELAPGQGIDVPPGTLHTALNRSGWDTCFSSVGATEPWRSPSGMKKTAPSGRRRSQEGSIFAKQEWLGCPFPHG